MRVIDVELVGDLGPLFDGSADRVVDRWMDETLDGMASKGLSEIGFWMDRYFKDPTPYYETQVMWERSGEDRVIHDRGIIYGPWLDGSSSRNVSTRFKGYPHWRRTIQYLEQELSPAYLERRKDALLRRLG